MRRVKTYLPVLLILFSPPASMMIWYCNYFLHGSFLELYAFLKEKGIWNSILQDIWGPYFFGSLKAYSILGIYALVQLVLMRFVPGDPFHGPKTRNGYVPVYKNNGRWATVVTLALFFLGGFVFHWFVPGDVYREFGYILGSLNLFALSFCVLLLFKGKYFPSGPDHGSSGNILFDYYWGTELYPRILGWDVKHFTNSRFSMMAWLLCFYCFASYQYETYGLLSNSLLVSCLLLTVYLGQFFWWETGYFRTMDIQHDRAGFYICWGVLVWVPAIYTSPAMYMATHPVHLPWWIAVAIFLPGVFFITSKNVSNRQRLKVRDADGKTNVWGKPPVLIRAKYTDEVSLSLMEHIRKQTIEDFKAEGKEVPFHPAYAVSEKLIANGRKGKAAGAGFYEYPQGGTKYLWPGLSELFSQNGQYDQPEMIDRMLFVQALDTVRCLEEGVLRSVADANIGSIFGWGFSPFNGGTLQYINGYGLKKFIERAKQLEAKYGERFSVPKLLQEKADKGELFVD